MVKRESIMVQGGMDDLVNTGRTSEECLVYVLVEKKIFVIPTIKTYYMYISIKLSLV